ncbi:hypothetical protein FE391_15930 [Nonomuraea sp. KC401]|uniref:hypothetical protein n=1 Tax=unclassified Nonomuraea TaxID=2593643 RepID=UPI0010FF4756|nr:MULTISPECIES: hypothetical protein [unclassified Nonomuraea]NBE96510.1 hypothetical protein [Nonomuraea sp. K271]TLF73020.1 hypothetical protein FE391_15930 [Nonomuraea sp. KC401]
MSTTAATARGARTRHVTASVEVDPLSHVATRRQSLTDNAADAVGSVACSLIATAAVTARRPAGRLVVARVGSWVHVGLSAR